MDCDYVMGWGAGGYLQTMSIETKYFFYNNINIFFTMRIAMMIWVGNKEVAWCLPNLGHNVNVNVLVCRSPAYIDSGIKHGIH